AARSANAVELNALVACWSGVHSKVELTTLLGGEVPYGPMNTIADILSDPHVAARGMLAKVAVAGQDPWTIAANPLRFGAHSHGPLYAPPALGADDNLLETLATTKEMDIDAKRALRGAFGSFATGVTVVTTRQSDGTPRGFTANSFTSVSLDPPLLLVCIAKVALSCDTFAQADHFAVNVLADDQKEVSGLFASQSVDKFDLAKWHVDAQNIPLIDKTIASFSCARHRLVDAGDHLILIGRVLEFSTSDGTPLGYYKGGYFEIGMDNALADAAASAGIVSLGVVLVCEGQILLCEDASGQISVPAAPAQTRSVEGLSDHLKGIGLIPDLDHLYAVYQNTQDASQRIIYHGVVAGYAPAGMRYFDLTALPLEQVRDAAERSMLRRYVQENQYGAFGIYHGTEVEGVVHAVTERRNYHI
ncbi:MAG: cag pathogenicity island protein Cag11, partial [Rhodobacteraceae bacterium]|nr:cag pathogenicity island protein Cag11 [Paracoccaceae bacterium]